MKWVLLTAAAVFILICAAVLFTPVWVELCAGFPGKGRTRAYLKIAFWRIDLLKQTPEMPQKGERSAAGEKPDAAGKIRAGLGAFGEIKDELFGLLSYISEKAVRIQLLKIGIEYGTGDSASTGILYGVISGAVYGAAGALSAKTQLDRADIKIEPDFYTAKINAGAQCIVKIRNAHIIIAAIKAWRLLTRIKKRRGDT